MQLQLRERMHTWTQIYHHHRSITSKTTTRSLNHPLTTYTSNLFHRSNTDCNVRKVLGNNLVTLPQAFRQAGYRTISLGKVFHPGCGTDDNFSWSSPAWSPPFDKPHQHAWVAVNSSVPEYNTTYLPDGIIAAKANATLSALASTVDTKPFFLAIGFHRPHLPFIFPEVRHQPDAHPHP